MSKSSSDLRIFIQRTGVMTCSDATEKPPGPPIPSQQSYFLWGLSLESYHFCFSIFLLFSRSMLRSLGGDKKSLINRLSCFCLSFFFLSDRFIVIRLDSLLSNENILILMTRVLATIYRLSPETVSFYNRLVLPCTELALISISASKVTKSNSSDKNSN